MPTTITTLVSKHLYDNKKRTRRSTDKRESDNEQFSSWERGAVLALGRPSLVLPLSLLREGGRGEASLPQGRLLPMNYSSGLFR